VFTFADRRTQGALAEVSCLDVEAGLDVLDVVMAGPAGRGGDTTTSPRRCCAPRIERSL
jgi:hypothetical protein